MWAYLVKLLAHVSSSSVPMHSRTSWEHMFVLAKNAIFTRRLTVILVVRHRGLEPQLVCDYFCCHLGSIGTNFELIGDAMDTAVWSHFPSPVVMVWAWSCLQFFVQGFGFDWYRFGVHQSCVVQPPESCVFCHQPSSYGVNFCLWLLLSVSGL